MRQKRFTQEQIIKILQEAEAGSNNKDICRKYGISEVTFYNWRVVFSIPYSTKAASLLLAL